MTHDDVVTYFESFGIGPMPSLSAELMDLTQDVIEDCQEYETQHLHAVVIFTPRHAALVDAVAVLCDGNAFRAHFCLLEAGYRYLADALLDEPDGQVLLRSWNVAIDEHVRDNILRVEDDYGHPVRTDDIH